MTEQTAGSVMNPLVEAIAEALAEHYINPTANDPAQEADYCACSELVGDWDEHLADVAATVAVGLLGTEHCIHSADMHQRHHDPANPVPGCPWCSGTGTSDVPTPEGTL